MSVYKPYEPLPGRQRELNDLPITFPLSWSKSVPNFVPYPRIFSSKPQPGFRITLPSRAAARCSGASIFCLLFSLFLALIFLCIKSSSEKVCDWMNELIKSWWILKCIDIKLWQCWQLRAFKFFIRHRSEISLELKWEEQCNSKSSFM